MDLDTDRCNPCPGVVSCLRRIAERTRAVRPGCVSSNFMPNLVAITASLPPSTRARGAEIPRCGPYRKCPRVSKKLMPASSAALTTRADLRKASMRQPKLLQPRPARETSSVSDFTAFEGSRLHSDSMRPTRPGFGRCGGSFGRCHTLDSAGANPKTFRPDAARRDGLQTGIFAVVIEIDGVGDAVSHRLENRWKLAARGLPTTTAAEVIAAEEGFHFLAAGFDGEKIARAFGVARTAV